MEGLASPSQTSEQSDKERNLPNGRQMDHMVKRFMESGSIPALSPWLMEKEDAKRQGEARHYKNTQRPWTRYQCIWGVALAGMSMSRGSEVDVWRGFEARLGAMLASLATG